MTALPLHAPVLRLASESVPSPIRKLFHDAALAEPPATVRDLHLDTQISPDGEKTLLAFTAERADLNLFMLLSPGLVRGSAERLEPEGEELRTWVASGGLDPPESPVTREPDVPWWCPLEHGPVRRYAYHTDTFDFVEVLVTDLTGVVFVRAIR